MTESVKVSRTDGIALVVLNRPQAFNAFDLEMVTRMADALGSLSADSSVRAVVLTGEGKAFCAGGDLKWAAAFSGGPPAGFHQLAGRFHQAVLEIRRMPKPVVAAIGGVAAGGGFSLALACDFRVLAASATLRQAYTSSGLCIDGGGTFTLPRLVGLARALEIAALDRPISAEQALGWGLATRVVKDGSALEEAMQLARGLTAISTHSFGWAKQLLTDSFDSSFETQLERERRGLAVCAAHPDGQEGLQAFRERRKPKFPVG
ncbi:MAG: enoyl-CoA hydratase-related protein [bacterium]